MTKLRALVWEEMFFSDMRQRYFGRVAARAKTTDDVVHVVLFVSTSATFASVIGGISGGTTVLALVSAVLAGIAWTMRLGHRATTFAEFSVSWGRIHSDYKRLWNDIGTGVVSDDAVSQRFEALKDRAEAIDRQAAKNRIDRKALLASYREAARMVQSQEPGERST